MGTLQNIFDSALSKAINPKNICTKILFRKLKEQGVILSKKETSQLKVKLKKEFAKLDFSSDENQLSQPEDVYEDLKSENPIVWTTIVDKHGKEVQVNVSQKEYIEEANRILEKISDQSLVSDLVDDWVKTVLPKLRSSNPSILQELFEQQEIFQKDLKGTWGKALDLFRTIIGICFEAGNDFNDLYIGQAVSKQDYVFEALTRLHARACQIALEIHTLLGSGYADGAHARWRSLHEVTVIAWFISERGQDTAEKYLLHKGVESRRAANSYQKYCERLGYDPIPEDEIEGVEQNFQQLKNRFGKNYLEVYGWAADELNNKNPNFSDIERAVGLDHWRPYYKLSSNNVHANPHGIYTRLGLGPEDNTKLAGPSIFGLADPGHGAAISLVQITDIVLTHHSDVDTLATLKILELLEKEAGNAFIEIHEILEKNARES